MIVTMKLYELFLECFGYKYPNEQEVIKSFGEKKLEELILEICPKRCSQTKKLIMLNELSTQVAKDMKTVEKLRSKLSIPECKSEMPKITYSQDHKMDQLQSLRKMRVVLDNPGGFTDENGKSMYFNMPLTTAFHFYFKIISG